jgi:uncharacterized membrane protein YkoI
MKMFLAPRWFYAICFLAIALPVWAESEQDRALEAVKAGEIVPLEQILQQVEKTSPGKVLKVGLDREDGIWVYTIKLLRDNGTLSRVCFDARNGTLLKNKLRHERR